MEVNPGYQFVCGPEFVQERYEDETVNQLCQ